MKNLANCTPSEFLRQTNKIRKSVKNWLDITGIMEIRKKMPSDMPIVRFDMTEAEKRAVLRRRAELMEEQARENLSEILDQLMEEHPQETLEVLALCCFVEPDHVDDYPTSHYLTALTEMINDEAVRNFFSFLMQLGQKNISTASEQ